MVGCIPRVHESSVFLLGVYLCSGEGASGRFRQVLSCISVLVQAVGLPTYVAADFNMSLVELADVGWLGASRLAPLTSDSRPTCSSRRPHAIGHDLCSSFVAGITCSVAAVAFV